MLLFQGLRWKQKTQRAKPFPRIPKRNSVTNSGGSTLISRVPLKKHCMLRRVLPCWLQIKEITLRRLFAFFKGKHHFFKKSVCGLAINRKPVGSALQKEQAKLLYCKMMLDFSRKQCQVLMFVIHGTHTCGSAIKSVIHFYLVALILN